MLFDCVVAVSVRMSGDDEVSWHVLALVVLLIRLEFRPGLKVIQSWRLKRCRSSTVQVHEPLELAFEESCAQADQDKTKIDVKIWKHARVWQWRWENV